MLHLCVSCRRLCAERGGGRGSVPGQRGLQVVQHADGLRLPVHEQQGRSSSAGAAGRVRPPGETLQLFRVSCLSESISCTVQKLWVTQQLRVQKSDTGDPCVALTNAGWHEVQSTVLSPVVSHIPVFEISLNR